VAATIETTRAGDGAESVKRPVRRTATARMRILGWYVVLLAIALVGTFLVQRAFLLNREDAAINEALDQEVEEFSQLAAGIDPATGEPFGTDVSAIFDTYLDRNVALPDEAVVTIVDGEPYKADTLGAGFADTPIMSEWIGVDETQRRDVETSAGPLRYLAVPVSSATGLHGVFVVAVLKAERIAQVDEAVRIGMVTAGSVFLLASVIAWFAAGAILKPLRTLRATAQTISEVDLTQRIPVEGDDEIADLGRTFNSMLDRLEAGFASQRRFIDDAGHELRTPITIVRGQLELMGDDPEERKETVALVTDELDRMTVIVNDLLDLAKAEQADFLEPAPFDLEEFMAGLIAKTEAISVREWRLEQAPDIVVNADRHRLTQAMMNLMRNAAEHSPPSVPVSIGADVDGETARLWVRDGGPGIPPGEQARLFDRFSRGETGRRTTGGAGLGLAIVKAIAEAHGGSVEVDSEPGRGTVFTMSIPARSIPAGAPRSAERP
jgi:signal transduction histidine kinase